MGNNKIKCKEKAVKNQSAPTSSKCDYQRGIKILTSSSITNAKVSQIGQKLKLINSLFKIKKCCFLEISKLIKVSSQKMGTFPKLNSNSKPKMFLLLLPSIFKSIRTTAESISILSSLTHLFYLKDPLNSQQLSPKKNQLLLSAVKQIILALQKANIQVGSVIVIGRAKLLVKETRVGQKVQSIDDKVENYTREVQENEIHESILRQELQIQKQSHPKTELVSHWPAFQKSLISLKGSQKEEQKEEEGESNKCRICFSDSSSSENPLISPCKCSGSCQFIHADCLQRWIQFKSIVNDRKFCISIEKVNCEICKAELPLDLAIDGKKSQYEIIKRPKDEDYILIQRIECSVKTIFILRNFPIEGISIGRDQSCYIKIEDISVSRVHSYIHYSQGRFRIIDNHSKFGTCVKQSPFILDVGKTPRGVQIGRNRMQIQIKKVTNQILPLEI